MNKLLINCFGTAAEGIDLDQLCVAGRELALSGRLLHRGLIYINKRRDSLTLASLGNWFCGEANCFLCRLEGVS